jgi:DNA polymerase-3 subunit gamma/tau
MPTLYRDYRPQTFAEVLGQNHVKITLQNEIAAGRPASAYLFCGPRAVGKTTLARVLAKAVNCEKRKDGAVEPCNECASCRSITTGQNLDVVEIDAASNTGVDNVRENIISFSRLAPSGAKFKVFIIDEVHMLSLSAFNALLKIIEEPPVYVIFILCTTEIQKVPATIISRCERFDFKRIGAKEIVKKLSVIAAAEKISVAPSVLNDIARLSGGHLRDAESLLGQIFSLGDKEITSEQAELVIPHYNSLEAVSLLEYLSRRDAAKAVALINNLTDSGVNVKVFTGEIIGLLRKVMLGKMNPELEAGLVLELDDELEKRLAQVTAHLDWDDIFLFTRRFLEAAADNKSPLIPQLPLELAVAELCLSSGNDQPSVSSRSVRPPLVSRPDNNSGPNRPPSRPLTKEAPAGPVKKETTPATADSAFNLSAAAVAAKWPELLVKIKKYNHSLSFVLQNCQPRDIKNGELGLTFRYKFHQDRINDAGIKNLVADALAEAFGVRLTVNSRLDENLEIKREEKASVKAEKTTSVPTAVPADKASGVLSDILKTFGGEVIN